MGSAPGSRPANAALLHTQLSGFYFLYYVAVGAWVPFWPVYLHTLGYSAAQIGIALGATGAVRIVAPVAWGALMDRSGRRTPWIALGMLVSAGFFAALPFVSSFGALVALHVAYAVFWNAALPAFDVVTLNHLGRTGADYTRIRLWGSIGFILAVFALGPVIDRTGVGPVPWIIVAGMLGMVIVGGLVPDVHDHRPHHAGSRGLAARVRQPAVIALLVAAFLSQLSFAPYYGFFSLYLEQHLYAHGTIGLLWGLGVIAEVIVFVWSGGIIRRFGARAVLIVCLLATAVRWAMLAFLVDQAALLAVSQVLHFLSFAMYHAATVHYVHELFPGRLQGRGQALLAAVSFGLGGSLGSLVTGSLWEVLGPQRVYLAAAACALVGGWVAVYAPRLRGVSEPVVKESTGVNA